MAVEFDARFIKRELPFHRGPRRITLGHARGDMGGEFVEGEDALVQALAGDSREFEFDHIELGGIFGCVMNLEAGGQGAGLGGGQMLIEDGIGMRVEVILHEHDFFSLQVMSG